MLNKKLVKERNISVENMNKIENIHSQLDLLLKHPTDNVVKEIQQLEYQLQELWKFPKDSDYHTHWYKIHDCSCPDMDNYDLSGLDKRWINSKCKYHGEMDD